MCRIADPQSRHGDACDRSPPLERGDRWRRIAGRRHDRRDRHLPGAQPQAPERRGCRQRQRGDVAGVCQRPPSYRADTGAARLAGHAARVMVRHPHGDAERRSLPRYALFGVRDDRVGGHDGAASAWPHPWKTRPGRPRLRRGRSAPTRMSGCASPTRMRCATRTGWSTSGTKTSSPACRPNCGARCSDGSNVFN